MGNTYNYHAKTKTGEYLKGSIVAESEKEALDRVEDTGLFVLSIEKAGGGEEPRAASAKEEPVKQNLLTVILGFGIVVVIVFYGFFIFLSFQDADKPPKAAPRRPAPASRAERSAPATDALDDILKPPKKNPFTLFDGRFAKGDASSGKTEALGKGREAGPAETRTGQGTAPTAGRSTEKDALSGSGTSGAALLAGASAPEAPDSRSAASSALPVAAPAARTASAPSPSSAVSSVQTMTAPSLSSASPTAPMPAAGGSSASTAKPAECSLLFGPWRAKAAKGLTDAFSCLQRPCVSFGSRLKESYRRSFSVLCGKGSLVHRVRNADPLLKILLLCYCAGLIFFTVLTSLFFGILMDIGKRVRSIDDELRRLRTCPEKDDQKGIGP